MALELQREDPEREKKNFAARGEKSDLGAVLVTGDPDEGRKRKNHMLGEEEVTNFGRVGGRQEKEEKRNREK